MGSKIYRIHTDTHRMSLNNWINAAGTIEEKIVFQSEPRVVDIDSRSSLCQFLVKEPILGAPGDDFWLPRTLMLTSHNELVRFTSCEESVALQSDGELRGTVILRHGEVLGTVIKATESSRSVLSKLSIDLEVRSMGEDVCSLCISAPSIEAAAIWMGAISANQKTSLSLEEVPEEPLGADMVWNGAHPSKMFHLLPKVKSVYSIEEEHLESDNEEQAKEESEEDRVWGNEYPCRNFHILSTVPCVFDVTPEERTVTTAALEEAVDPGPEEPLDEEKFEAVVDDDGETVKEGWLLKQHHNIFKGFSKRYCRLAKGSLELYATKTDETPLVKMDLGGAGIDTIGGKCPSIRVNLAIAAGRKGKYDHYVLQFKDHGEMGEWGDAMHKCASAQIGEERHLVAVTCI